MRVTKPIAIHTSKFRNRIKNLSEDGYLKPDWWFTGLFKYHCDVEHVVRQIIKFWDDRAKKENVFIVPVGAIGLTSTGRWHYHAVPLVSRHLSYRQIKPHWKCGFGYAKMYQPGEGAIPYTLNSKKHFYLPVKKPFAPRRWRGKGKNLPIELDDGKWNVVLNSI